MVYGSASLLILFFSIFFILILNFINKQNAYNFQAEQAPLIIPVRDSQGNLTLNPTDPSRYQLRTLANPAGTLLPTVGLIVEF
jgi:hypothetical protein